MKISALLSFFSKTFSTDLHFSLSDPTLCYSILTSPPPVSSSNISNNIALVSSYWHLMSLPGQGLSYNMHCLSFDKITYPFTFPISSFPWHRFFSVWLSRSIFKSAQLVLIYPRLVSFTLESCSCLSFLRALIFRSNI